MDKKLEKYYNYIVNDLMGKVKVDAPYSFFIDGAEIDYRGIASRSGFTIYHRFNSDLKDYLIERYGVRNDESELNRIWFRFRNRVREEILRPNLNDEIWISD
jgi:hypothetical protein